jgi:16S rRNA pseudouridine516 synthase
MMHKPPGLVSATEDKRDETVVDILQPEDRLFEPFPVGRLDKDTEGLLLLTNDGTLSHQLLSPKKHVQKLYYAKINGEVTEKTIKQFEAGVTLDDEYVTKPAILKILEAGPVSEIEIIITEGKFHQIKRMFEAVEMEVTYLKRLQMGSLKLDEDLQLGEYRELSDEELNSLIEDTKKS